MRLIEGVSRETLDRLAVYADMLRRWNTRIRLTNLDVGVDSPAMAESLELRRFFPPVVSAALDIGSGNGLPALPLSIAFDVPYVVAESDKRKAAFLREVARELACPVVVETRRIEDMPEQPYDLITARAFASLSRLAGLAYPRQALGCVCLFPKGRSVETEVNDALRDWSFEWSAEPLGSGCVVRMSTIRPRT